MKKIYLFFVFLLLSGCSFSIQPDIKDISISCPSILFSSEHRVYIDTSLDKISIDNLDYKSVLNNAVFSKECNIIDNSFNSELSILFVVKPLDDEIDLIEIPFYLAILNQYEELQDILYFSLSGKFKSNLDTKKLVETDLIKIINLSHESINQNSIIIIGHVLDNQRKEILN